MVTVERASFREAMSRVGAAVHVITTRDETGPHGFTASAVCSVTDAPPTLLFCLNRSTSSHALFAVGRPTCVNTLSAGQKEISAVFADRDKIDIRFQHGDWDTIETGAPTLQGAAVCFDGVISDMVDVGSHSVVFLQIQAIRIEAANPVLIYFSRDYHQLPALPLEIET